MAVSRTVRRPEGRGDRSRVPPGQTVTSGFPVLSAGPVPRTRPGGWSFGVSGAVDRPVSWDRDAFRALPRTRVTVDLHCVTGWSKLDTTWTGVAVDSLLEAAGPTGRYVLAHSDGGYTTNVPPAGVLGAVRLSQLR
jgi:DMSO/TMAO reductase YedYZ molybdopterin-dependent catalytic subunit